MRSLIRFNWLFYEGQWFCSQTRQKWSDRIQSTCLDYIYLVALQLFYRHKDQYYVFSLAGPMKRREMAELKCLAQHMSISPPPIFHSFFLSLSLFPIAPLLSFIRFYTPTLFYLSQLFDSAWQLYPIHWWLCLFHPKCSYLPLS